MEIREQVGRNVRRYRLEKDWSQEELAFESGIHQTYLSGIENGTRNPTVPALIANQRSLCPPSRARAYFKEGGGTPVWPAPLEIPRGAPFTSSNTAWGSPEPCRSNTAPRNFITFLSAAR